MKHVYRVPFERNSPRVKKLRAQYVQVNVHSETFTVIQIVYSTNTYYVNDISLSTHNVCESEVHTVGLIVLYSIALSLYDLQNSKYSILYFYTDHISLGILGQTP